MYYEIIDTRRAKSKKGKDYYLFSKFDVNQVRTAQDPAISNFTIYWEMYGLPDVFNIFLSKFWRFWMPYFLQYGPNKYQTWRDFTNLGLPFLTIWFCLVSIVNPIRRGLACTCAHVAHVTLLCLLHSTDWREKEGRLAIKVSLECWRFFSGGRGGVAIFISNYDNTKTTRQQNRLLRKL